MYEERQRLLQRKADEIGFPAAVLLPDSEIAQFARETVKEHWIEQGIWNDEWEEREATWRWKHEAPVELESESETEPEGTDGVGVAKATEE